MGLRDVMGSRMGLWLCGLARWWHRGWDVGDGFKWSRRLVTLRWVSVNILALLPEGATAFEKVIANVLGLYRLGYPQSYLEKQWALQPSDQRASAPTSYA